MVFLSFRLFVSKKSEKVNIFVRESCREFARFLRRRGKKQKKKRGKKSCLRCHPKVPIVAHPWSFFLLRVVHLGLIRWFIYFVMRISVTVY